MSRFLSGLGLRFRRLAGDDRGVVGMIYGLMIVVFCGLAALAVDTAYIHTVRGRMQNAADAAALAGASALISNGEDLAWMRQEILDYGQRNLRDEDEPLKALTVQDVTFLKDSQPASEDPDAVEVVVAREAERDNALGLFFGPVIDVDQASISVVARAGIVGAADSMCVKPFIVPTKYTWDDYADPDPKVSGNGQLDVTSSAELDSVVTLGFTDADLGAPILLKPGDPAAAIVPSQYNLVDLPPVNKGTPITGGDMVRVNLMGCDGSNASATVGPDDELLLEPGVTGGPTKQGILDLINQDAGAYWDAATGTIKGSSHADPAASPRVAIVAFYDPRYPPVSGRTTLKIYQVAAVFIESIDSQGNVAARFVRTVARSPEVTDVSDNTGDFLYVTRLLRDASR